MTENAGYVLGDDPYQMFSKPDETVRVSPVNA